MKEPPIARYLFQLLNGLPKMFRSFSVIAKLATQAVAIRVSKGNGFSRLLRRLRMTMRVGESSVLSERFFRR